MAITVDKDGAATYREAKDEDPETFQLEPDAVQAIFDLADKLDHFKRPLESGLKVAKTGDKTFRWEDGADASEIKFNYSTDENARLLQDWFERITESERAMMLLRRAIRFDKLGVNDAVLRVDTAWSRSVWWDASSSCRCSTGSPRTKRSSTWPGSGPPGWPTRCAPPERPRRMKRAAASVLCGLCGWTPAGQAEPSPAQAAVPSEPSTDEQQDLMRALNEGTSPVDLIRGAGSASRKYPNCVQRAEIERALAKAAIETNDIPRIVKYGEACRGSPRRTIFSCWTGWPLRSWFWAARKTPRRPTSTLARSRISSIRCPSPPARTPRAGRTIRSARMGRALMYQARARTIQNDNQDALRLAARAFSAYPGEESAREWAEVLLHLGQQAEAIEHLAEAFVDPGSLRAPTNSVRATASCWASCTRSCTARRRAWAI